MSRRRVVVTGLGLISPVGNTVPEGWAQLIAGRSGIARITRFDASGLPCQIAGEVKGFDVEQYMPAKEARHMDTFIHYGVAAAAQAVADAGLAHGEALGEEGAERIGCMVGSGIGGLQLIEQTHDEYRERGARRISPFFVPASIINMISGHISIRFGYTGPNMAIVTACTTGLHCIGEAGRVIELDSLVGAVKEIGERVGIATPNISALLGLTRLFGRVRGIYPTVQNAK